jgi:hypothetical protein
MKRYMRNVAVGAMALGIGLVGTATSAQAVPDPDNKFVVTAGCPDGAGGFVFIDVIPSGSKVFVLDEEGEPTGEKLFLRSIDLATFSDAGALLFEFNKTYGNRTGHGEAVSCSGSFVGEPGTRTFFDVLVTMP